MDEDPNVGILNPQKKAKLNQDSDSDDDGEDVPEQYAVVDMELLEADLKVSYVDEHAKWKAKQAKENPAPEKPKRAKWKYDGEKPMNNPQNLPEGWTWDEPDLDKLDIDAQIQRCEERIAEQIMPFYFEQKLKGYQEAKALRIKLESSEKGSYSSNVLKRIDTLKKLEILFETGEDKYNQLPNVKALLQAYRSHKLDWYDVLVTYWSHGRQLCEPRPHNWHEFEAINQKHEGWKSFWVEGFNGPGPQRQNAAKQQHIPDAEGFHSYTAGVRLGSVAGMYAVQPPGMVKAPVVRPGTYPIVGAPWNAVAPTAHHPWWVDLEFMHDTGSNTMSIYESDIVTLMGNYQTPYILRPMLTGATLVYDFTGRAHLRNKIMVQVCLLTGRNPANSLRMTEWERTDAIISPGTYIPGASVRLDDQWLRGAVYQGTQPDNVQSLRFAVKKTGLDMNTVLTAPGPRTFFPGALPPYGYMAPWVTFITLPAGVAAAKAPPKMARV